MTMTWKTDEYMPYAPEELEQHFVKFHQGHVTEYRKTNREYGERFWVLTTLKRLFDEFLLSGYSPNSALVQLIESVFTDPPEGFRNWTDALGDAPRLFFEVNMPKPVEYSEFLRNKFQEVTLPPLSFLDQVPPGTRFEGQTKVDAVIFGVPGVAVLFEGKVLSDASPKVIYDVTRNQIARSIDVLLETPDISVKANSDGELLRQSRNPDQSFFVLLTPAIFK